jgi:hypothetical protein
MRLIYGVVVAAATVLMGSGLAPAQFAGNGVTIHVSPKGDDAQPGTAERPIQTLGRVESRLMEMPLVTEVVFHKGVYRGGLNIRPLEGADPARALLIRAAEGEEVIFDGAGSLAQVQPLDGAPGVFVTPFQYTEGEYPKLWEADTRVRYWLVADLASVKHFPSSFTHAGGKLYFHTSDGKAPSTHRIGISGADCGVFANRPRVTVRGLAFRNYLARAKWSTGVDLRTRQITVENCRSWNCSMGFIVTGDENRVLNCRAEDVGGGVYVGGSNARIEGSRFIKTRDAFMLPMYSQDDTGIQFYVPAGNGQILGNLCVGFDKGIFLKASGDTYVVEHNTLVGPHSGIGNTRWADQNNPPKGSYRYNLIVAPEEPVMFAKGVPPGVMSHNCFWMPEGPGVSAEEQLKGKVAGNASIIADPRFVDEQAQDYRLSSSSPCRNVADARGACGAFPAVGREYKDRRPPEVELWAKAPVVLIPAAKAGATPRALTTERTFPLQVWTRDGAGTPARMQLKLGEAEWTAAQPVRSRVEITIPTGQTHLDVSVRVADEAGNWSEAKAIRCELSEKPPAPQLVGVPEVHATSRGLAVAFVANEPVFATLEFGPTSAHGRKAESLSREEQPVRQYRTAHVLAPEPSELAGMKSVHYRLRLENRRGTVMTTPDRKVDLEGGPRTLYLSPEGRDGNPGTAAASWKSLQHAVDRALPGDTIVLRPGIYDTPATLTHGGVEGAPITLRAERKWQAILDSNRQAETMLHLVEAPFVEIRDVEIRWYGAVAVGLERSPNVSVIGCKIWNDFWSGWPTGTAVRMGFSPRFVGERNVCFRQENAFWLYSSPDARLVQNTCVSNLYSGAAFYHSVRGSVCKNNDFAYNGNDQIVIEISEDPTADLASFECDYNNLGTQLREQPAGSIFDSVVPREGILFGYSKAIVGFTAPGVRKRFVSMEEWRAYSGKDRHSIFADPLHRSCVRQQFEIDPQSPNIGAGENGTTIGAFGPARQ